MVSNKTLIFNKIPSGLPVAGEHLVVEDRPLDISAPPPGGLVVEILSISLDPYLRIRMRDPSTPGFVPAFRPGEPVSNSAVARVLASDSPDYRPGDLVCAPVPFAEYAAIPASELPAVDKIDNPHGLPPDYFLGPLGMPGLTAYSSLYEIGKPKKGETLFVSSAAGAVGSMVGQLAKREGLRVIGSVGDDDKLRFIVDELGFGGGFNYKKESPGDAVPRLAPEGLDLYYENVGGAHLEAALANLKNFGRIVVCGMIECYNTPLEQRYGVRNLVEVFAKRLTMRGFVVLDPDFGPAYSAEHQRNVQRWIADGSLRARLHVARGGIDRAADAFADIFRGRNFGKAVLEVKKA
ncbi:hypothetical protein F4809DRAFT_652020 [Biscogniauxia mediterranea]|nr:hypothetical protein F4809DRAFT_652020 [Biscogniauxia mediterranea]